MCWVVYEYYIGVIMAILPAAVRAALTHYALVNRERCVMAVSAASNAYQNA